MEQDVISDICDISDDGDIEPIYDIDLNSNNGEGEEYLPIDRTKWFSELSIYPSAISEFKFFIRLLDLPKFFEKYNYYDAFFYSYDRLDMVYLLLRYINYTAVEFAEYVVKNYFIPEFDGLFMTAAVEQSKYHPEKDIGIFLEEFYLEIGEFVIELISVADGILPADLLTGDEDYVPDEKMIYGISRKLRRFCRKLLFGQYYRGILEDYKITIGKHFFTKNEEHFYRITEKTLDYLFHHMQPIISKINRYYLQLVDPLVDDGILLRSMDDIFSPAELLKTHCDPINYFNSVMDNLLYDMENDNILIGISEYENFLYPAEKKNKKYAYWMNHMGYSPACTKSSFDIAMEKANQYNLSVYPEKPLHNMLEVFVQHKLVENVEVIISRIASMMIEHRNNSPGIFNMYDTTDLETAFQLLSLSNDIRETYDSFLSTLLEKHLLPTEYPIEFVLRLVSRILDVDIIYYQQNMHPTEIKNSLHHKYNQPIRIYHTNLSDYYILYPSDGEFIPINIKKIIPKNYTIVEV